jgi:aminoglycoside phosphotransferase (APT) family kinase protein
MNNKQIYFRSILALIFCINAQGMCDLKEKIKDLLPASDNTIIECIAFKSGKTNNTALCTTKSGTQYIFRYPKKYDALSNFNEALAVTQKASELYLTPVLYNYNKNTQEILMAYIQSSAWPSYEEDRQPYISTMRLLRQFHGAMRFHYSKTIQHQKVYHPFKGILRNLQALMLNPEMPKHIKTAFNTIELFEKKMNPWLKHNATICHGDFHRGNVLLENLGTELAPWIIDFDSLHLGHPYFDVVKFSCKLDPSQRKTLFQDYLKSQTLTKEQINHFDIMDNTLCMIVVIIRFNTAAQTLKSTQVEDILSKKDMEELLESSDQLPSQSTIRADDPDPKKQQLAAIYALREFLRKTE